MKIYGHDGKHYKVYMTSPLNQVEHWISKHDKGLIYEGPNKRIIFLVVETDGNNSKEHYLDYELKNGYKWDGASIPKRTQWLIGKPTDKEFRVASLFHDLGYENRERRVLQDVVFYYVLCISPVPRWKADLMYKAVRAGGFVYYASDTSKFWRKVRGWL